MRCLRCGQEYRAEQGAACPYCDPSAIAPAGYTPKHLVDTVFTRRSAMQGERKQVTVLFCDVVQSTLIAERLGPDEMHRLLDRLFKLVLEAVHRHEGTVNQFLGDGVMALFGAPLAHEKHARQAVAAALAIVREAPSGLAEFTHASGLPLAVRVGINTGRVVVGSIGDDLRMDYTAIGDTTNLAARLQQLAEPGTVLVSESTYRDIEEQFDVVPLGTRAVKGRTEPVRVYRVAGVRGPGAVERRLRAPLIGREAQTQAVEGCVARLLEVGEGGVLCVIGEPGVGKSRLLAETRRRADGVGFLWLEGRSFFLTQRLSYGPLVDILRHYTGITETDDDAAAWTKLDGRLVTLLGDQSADYAPYLATLLGITPPEAFLERIRYLDAGAIGRQILFTSRRLLERLASEQPVVLVFEDLHWIDQSSAELLEHLVPLAAAIPLLLCFVTRPESVGPSATLRALAADRLRARYTEIALGALSALESEQLVTSLLHDAPPGGLQSLIFGKAEGNPFFTEEIVRALIATEAIVRDDVTGRWQATTRLGDITIPDTLQGVIMARVDRLADDVKHVLRLASVIGRTFLYRLLRTIGDTARPLDEPLTELQSLDIIREARSRPEIEYIFKHILVQQATYESILVDARRQLHQHVARAIEALFADRLDDFVGALAYHYAQAQDWEKARDYINKAGDRAGRVAGDTEALAHYQQAFVTCERLLGQRWSSDDRAELEGKMGEAFFRRGDHHKARDYLHKALEHLGHPLPTSRRGTWAAIGVQALRQLRHRAIGVPHDEASDTGGRLRMYECLAWIDYFMDQERFPLDALLMLNVAERLGEHVPVVKGLTAIGGIADLLRWSRVAAFYHARAIRLAEGLQHPIATGFAHLGRGAHQFRLGRSRPALDDFSRAASAYREAGDLHGWGVAATMQAWALRQGGELTRSLTLSETITQIGEETGDDQVRAWGLHGHGWTLWHLGDFDQAATRLSDAIALYRRVPDYPAIAEATADLGLCRLRQGRLGEAHGLVSDSNRMIVERDLRGVVCTRPRLSLAETELAVFEAAPGDRTAATRVKAACRSALRQASIDRQALAPACRVMGTYRWLVGDRVGAETSWRRALAAADDTDAKYESALSHLELGRRLRRHEHLRKAEAIFSDLRARHDLTRTRQGFLDLRSTT